MNATHPFETNLDRHPSNYIPLSPVSFLTRAASAFANKLAVIDGERRYTYAQLLDRCTRLASGTGDSLASNGSIPWRSSHRTFRR